MRCENQNSMATLKIYSDIEREQEKAVARFWGDVEGVSFSDIDAFCQSIPEDDNVIDIRLHCDGGSVTEGWAIYDRLRATGKEITATAEGNCASMATIVLMAAPKERRRAYENAHLCIHNPWICGYALGEVVTADDLQKAANDLRSEQERMVNLYVERCGCSREEAQALMDEDKFIDPARAKELGLIGEIVPPMSASKTPKHNQHIMQKDEKEVRVKASVLDRILAKLGLKSLEDFKDDEVQGMDLNTADGNTIRIEREDGEPQVGDVASPDGEWLMPDGSTIVVQDGVIAEIRPKEDAPGDEARDEEGGDPDTTEELDDRDEEEQRLRDRIAELEKENEELRQRLEEATANAKTTDDLRILNLVKMAGGEKALAQIKTNYKPAGREPDGKMAERRATAQAMTADDIIAAADNAKKKK